MNDREIGITEMQTFGASLRYWRKAHTLTQTQAAARIGVPVDRYRSWEQGRYEPEALVRELVASKMSAAK